MKMINRFSKLTNPALILAAALGLVLSPAVSMANPAAKSKHHHTQAVHHPTGQTVQFQGQEASRPDWDHDADGFYTPSRSPGRNELTSS